PAAARRDLARHGRSLALLQRAWIRRAAHFREPARQWSVVLRDAVVRDQLRLAPERTAARRRARLPDAAHRADAAKIVRLTTADKRPRRGTSRVQPTLECSRKSMR